MMRCSVTVEESTWIDDLVPSAPMSITVCFEEGFGLILLREVEVICGDVIAGVVNTVCVPLVGFIILGIFTAGVIALVWLTILPPLDAFIYRGLTTTGAFVAELADILITVVPPVRENQPIDEKVLI